MESNRNHFYQVFPQILSTVLAMAMLYAVIVWAVRKETVVYFNVLNQSKPPGFFIICQLFFYPAIVIFAAFMANRIEKKTTAMIGASAAFLVKLLCMALIGSCMLIQFKLDLNRYVDSGNNVYFTNQNQMLREKWRTEVIEYSHDEQGHRFCPYSNTQGTKTVILVGDSYIYGDKLNDQDTLCSQLGISAEKELNESWRVLNLGFNSIGILSEIRIAEDYSKKNKTDWIVIGYTGAHNASRFCDSFCQLRLLNNSILVKGIAVLFGAETISRAIKSISNQFLTEEGNNDMFDKATVLLSKLSESHNIIILCYTGDDPYILNMKKELANKVHFLDYKLPHKEPFLSPLEIPYDGHPSARANKEIASKITEFILRYTTPDNK